MRGVAVWKCVRLRMQVSARRPCDVVFANGVVSVVVGNGDVVLMLLLSLRLKMLLALELLMVPLLLLAIVLLMLVWLPLNKTLRNVKHD